MKVLKEFSEECKGCKGCAAIRAIRRCEHNVVTLINQCPCQACLIKSMCADPCGSFLLSYMNRFKE